MTPLAGETVVGHVIAVMGCRSPGGLPTETFLLIGGRGRGGTDLGDMMWGDEALPQPGPGANTRDGSTVQLLCLLYNSSKSMTEDTYVHV